MESPKGWLGGLIKTLYLIIVYSFGMETSIRIIFGHASCLFQLSQKRPHFRQKSGSDTPGTGIARTISREGSEETAGSKSRSLFSTGK
jgi:hypothetical protein